MRVLTVYYKHRPGGMMQMLYRMLLGGTERGWEMHYLSVEPYRIAHPRLHPHHLPSPGRHDTVWFWTWFFLTAPIVSTVLALRHRIDLLAVFEGSYAWAVLPAKRLLGCRLIVFLQSDVATINRLHGRPALLRRLEQHMERASLQAADHIIATNQGLADLVRTRWQLPAEKITVVPNNVRLPDLDTAAARAQLRRDLPLPAHAFLIATSGSFSPRKNLPLLLQSFSRIETPRAHLVVIGQSPDAREWRQIVEHAMSGANGSRIHFLGWRSDVTRVLAGCDLFVFPSRHEGSPLSLIEALRVGLPCLGSDVHEIREVLGDDPDTLFPVDDVDVLQRRIERAVGDPAFYARLRALCAQRAKIYDFDWEARVAAIMSAPARPAAREGCAA